MTLADRIFLALAVVALGVLTQIEFVARSWQPKRDARLVADRIGCAAIAIVMAAALCIVFWPGRWTW